MCAVEGCKVKTGEKYRCAVHAAEHNQRVIAWRAAKATTTERRAS